MKAYVISLERSTERRAHIEAQVRGIDHEFVQAVDGRTLDRSEWPDWLPLGLVGCGLSHLNAYRAILRSGGPGLVLEDDAILPDRLPEFRFVADGDVVLLYYRTHPSVTECALIGGGVLRKPSAPVAATTAYAITPGACERLLDFNPPKRGLGPDDWSHFPVSVWCVYPRPVGVRLDFPSTLGYAKGRLVAAWLRTWNRRRIERRMSCFVADNDPPW